VGHYPPPAKLDGTAPHVVIPAGSTLRRVHPQATAPDGFDSPRSGVFGGGGRFDGTVSRGYRTLCASDAPETAIAERFLREFAATPGTPRYLPQKSLRGQVLSELRTTTDLTLIRLVSARDLAAVHQDDWLVTSRADEFAATREWGAWLHDQVPRAQGILWQSIADMPRSTIVLFEDRCLGPRPVVDVPEHRRLLDAPEQAGWLAGLLAPYGVRTHVTDRRPPKFFVNYRTGDGDAASLMLHNELSRRFGESRVFRDTRSIPCGTSDFERVLVRNARGCEVMFPVVGRTWEWCADQAKNRYLEDPEDWVRREILEAREQDAEVVPVLVGTRMPLQKENLPRPLRFLASVQYLHLPNSFEEPDVQVLVDKLLTQRPDLDD
jgi:hypothetical protein